MDRPHAAPAILLLPLTLWTAAGCGPRSERGPDPGALPAPPLTARVAYVPSFDAGLVSAIDLTTNRVLWALKVSEGAGERPARSAMGIAATRDGRLVFTGDVARGEVVVVDADARRIVRRIPVPHAVHAVDLSPDDRELWVAGRLEGLPWLSATSIVDTRTLEVVETLSAGLGNAAHFAFTPDGGQVWAASISTNLVWVRDARTRALLGVVPLPAAGPAGRTPEGREGLVGYNGIAVTPDGARAFAVGPEPGTLFAIDVASRRVVGGVPIGQRAHDVAVTRDGREAWVANDAGTVTIVDAETLEVLGQLDMRRFVDEMTFAHVAFSPDGARAYLSWERDVVVVDVGGREVVAVIPVPEEPHEMTLEDYFVRP